MHEPRQTHRLRQRPSDEDYASNSIITPFLAAVVPTQFVNAFSRIHMQDISISVKKAVGVGVE